MATEAALVKAIERAIRGKWPDAWTFKAVGHPYQLAGVPDLLVAVEGRLIALEVKWQSPGESKEHARGRATMLQLQEIEKLRRAGCGAEVVVSVEEAMAVVEKLLERT